MKKLKLTSREYVIAGVLVLAGVYGFLGVIVTTAIIGLVGGAVLGANLPAKWRAKLVMGRKAQTAPTITVPPAPPVPGERRDDVYGGGS